MVPELIAGVGCLVSLVGSVAAAASSYAAGQATLRALELRVTALEGKSVSRDVLDAHVQRLDEKLNTLLTSQEHLNTRIDAFLQQVTSASMHRGPHH